GLRIFNTFNSGDVTLRIDLAYLEGFAPYPKKHAWLVAQVLGKPYGQIHIVPSYYELVRRNGTSGAGDSPLEQKWWTLTVPARNSWWASTPAAVAEQDLVWGDAVPADGGSRARRSRQWAELAMWYPAMAPAA